MIVVEILRNIFLMPLELVFEVIYTTALNNTHSEGLSIICMSLVVSTFVLPLYKQAEKLEQEQRAKEKELSLWAEHIKKHFKGDEKTMMLDAYYRENHYSPLYQLRGSLSILLQIPFFMAAYDLLGTLFAEDSRNSAGFFLISDLRYPDGLISFAGISINLLPILMTLISLVATYIYTKGLPIKTAARSLVLPVIFLVVLYKSPSALLLYWTMNNVYSLIKTIVIKHFESKKINKGAIQKSKRTFKPKGRFANMVESFLNMPPKTSSFIFPVLFMSVLTGLLIPLTYLSASPEEFIDITTLENPNSFLIHSFFIAVGFFVVWPSVFYYLASKKLKNIFAVMMFGISAVSVVNFMFFGKDTGIINTILVFDNVPTYSLSQVIVNTIVVIFVFAICVFLYRYKKACNLMLAAAVFASLTVSAIDFAKINDTYSSVMNHTDDFREDDNPQIVLSSTGENVMVIMLDKAMSRYIPYVFNEFPELKEQYDGFEYYPNTVSFGQYTLFGSSPLFGGYEYTPDQMDARADVSLKDKHDESLKVLPELFSEQGYGVNVMDLPFPGWSFKADYSSFEDIENCHSYHAEDFYNGNSESHTNVKNRRKRNLFMYSIFRCSPLCLQTVIYDNGNYLSSKEDAYNVYDILSNYRVLEKMDEMTQISNDKEGYLLLLGNETTHDLTNLRNYDPYTPYEFTEGYNISDGNQEIYLWNWHQAATYECLVAAMRELGNYMDYLKEIGVYDNTRIIIASDHGTNLYVFEDMMGDDLFTAEWYNCLLMVKDFNSTGFVTNDSFMTNADVPTIALDGIVDNPHNPYTGKPINSDPKNGDIVIGFSLSQDDSIWNPDYNPGNTFTYDENFEWYKLINKDIYNNNNWVPIDKPEV